MKRREAIRNIALASTATIFLIACNDKNVSEFLIDGQLNLNQKHKDYLATISETILPVKNISDKISPPLDFILTMLNDCASSDDLSKYVSGFEQYKMLMKENSLKIKSSASEDIISSITTVLESETPQEELIHFINTTKDLSVWNLKTSEYYKTEIEGYKMIPDAYQACINI